MTECQEDFFNDSGFIYYGDVITILGNFLFRISLTVIKKFNFYSYKNKGNHVWVNHYGR